MAVISKVESPNHHDALRSVDMIELIKNGAAINAAAASTPELITRARIDAGPTGTLLFQGERGWDEARTPWVINVDQQPAAVALVRSVDDVSAVVTSASRNGLEVMAQSTGHGALAVRPHGTGAYCRAERRSCQPSRAHGMGRIWSGMAGCDGSHRRARPRCSGQFGARCRDCRLPPLRRHQLAVSLSRSRRQ
jgi:hypothetical protein